MTEGRSRQLWDHTSQVLALIANVNRGKDQPAFRPAQFHAFEAAKENEANVFRLTPKESMRVLKRYYGGTDGR